MQKNMDENQYSNLKTIIDEKQENRISINFETGEVLIIAKDTDALTRGIEAAKRKQWI